MLGLRNGKESEAAFAFAFAEDDDVAADDDEAAGFFPLSSRRDAEDLVVDGVVAALAELLGGCMSGKKPAKLEKSGPMLLMAPMLPKAPKPPSPPRAPSPGKPPNMLSGFLGSSEESRGFLGSRPANGLFLGSNEAPKSEAAVFGSKAPNIFGSKAASNGLFFMSSPLN